MCAERGQVCFSDLECCEPYQCDNRSFYCDKKPKPPTVPTPTPSPVPGGTPFSFSFDFDESGDDDDDFWDTWVPAPAPTDKTLPPVSETELSFEFEEDEEPDRPTDMDKPKNDKDCFDRLSDNMRVSALLPRSVLGQKKTIQQEHAICFFVSSCFKVFVLCTFAVFEFSVPDICFVSKRETNAWLWNGGQKGLLISGHKQNTDALLLFLSTPP